MPEYDAALIVFAKNPVPGRVKTRLTTLLSSRDAAALYSAFLKDALTAYRSLPVDTLLFMIPSPDPVPKGLIPDTIRLFEQEGPDLGSRMSKAFECVLNEYGRAVIIGTDHPTLPLHYIRKAFDVLKRPGHISIGPSDDGGYYLLGMSTLHRSLFKDMTYSHDRVYQQTLQRIRKTGRIVDILPEWYDVDNPDDLRRLVREVPSAENLTHTRTLLERLQQTYPLEQNDTTP